ncbi:MAG: htrA, partial [Bacillales bacterium]|nr:htrA [Bacillales bacterium]
GTGLQSINEISTYDQQQTLGLPKDVNEGVVVTSIEKESPAERGGLKIYDVIIEIKGDKITDLPTLRKVLYSKVKIGDKADLKVYRSGKIETVTITFEETNIK